MQAFYNRQLLQQKLKKKAADNFSMTIFLYWMLWFALKATRQALSLAQAFSQASGPPVRPEEQGMLS